MKRLLFVLMAVMVPAMLLAQPMDTMTIYSENFDGPTHTMTPTTGSNLGGTLGDWRVAGVGVTYDDWPNNYQLYKSSPKCYHSPVYNANGNSNATTAAFPLNTTPFVLSHVYVDFDHICKVHQIDNTAIYYQLANGIDEDGNFNWGQWKLLNFSSTSAFYYGEAKGTSNITSGKFSQSAYSNWQASSMTAVPTNAWWHHEKFDVSQFLLQDPDIANPTHVRFQFRLSKPTSSSTGTQDCAGWYLDNVVVLLSNCELIAPRITMVAPFYYNVGNNFTNDVGPYTIKSRLTDNDTIALSSVVFSYEINSGPTVVVPNTNAFSNNSLTASGHTVDAQWQLPAICYQDTIYYHIYMEDTHGSKARFDTFLVAHHNYTNIHQNDVRLDSLNTMPHCLITGVPQDVSVFFTNRSDAQNSPTANEMISGTFKIEVRSEAGTLTHTSTHNWTGDICFDIPSSQSLGSFTPTHGYNYVTVYVTTRNGQADGYHMNDTLRINPYACDSLLQGHYTVGGTNPDFANMTAVKEALDYCGLGGPAVFHLRPGTYTEFDFDQNYIGQSSVNTITFQGDNPNSVIIVNDNLDNGANIFGAVTLVNVKDYIFKNLTIQANDTNVSRGVVIRGNGSRNILFDGCTINSKNVNTTDLTSCAVSRTTATTGVPDTITFRNCTIGGGNVGFNYVGANNKRNLITIDNCDITACYRGVVFSYTNGVISNNHIKQYSSSNPQNFTAVYVSYPTGIDIAGNTVDSVTKMEYGVYLTNATLQDYYIRDNHLKVGNGPAAIYVNSSSSTHNTNTNMDGHILDNEVILYPVTANNSYAIHINNSNDLKVINNSVLVKSDAPFSNTAAIYISNGAGNTFLHNNIFMNKTVTADNTDYPLYLNANATATGTFNDFYSTSGVIAYKTVARYTVAELENAISTLTDNISMMPTIANEDESLLPDPMSGLECWRQSPVMKDIRGIDRSELTYMGAYANVIPNVDGELTSIVSPVLGECPQSSYEITVKVTNKGGHTLNFASTPATIQLISNSLNINQTINMNTGSLAPMNSMNKVLTSGVVIPSNQPVDFTMIINVPGDNQHANDTLRQNFTLEYIIPDYEENFSNGTAQTWTIEQLSGAGNWTFQNGEGVNPTIMPVYGTGRLFFNSKNFAANTSSRAILPVTVLNTATNPILELWFAHDNTNSANNKNDEMTVKISTDGGVNYSNLIPQGQTTAPIKRYKQSATTPTWERYVFDLSNYVSTGCVYIAFDATSKAGNNLNVDRIRVRSLFPNDIAVTKIYSAGETPTQYEMRGVVSAVVRNEGSQAQSNIPVYLNVTGATEAPWQDTLLIPSLAPNTETIITFPDHLYNVNEVKDVEVRCANDMHNINNSKHWRMEANLNVANYADTTNDIVLIGDYNTIIRPCVRYKTNEELAVTAVKYYYDQTYIADPENGFKAFVSDASGNVLATSQVVEFSSLQQGAWNIIPIHNFALTNTVSEFYVGLEMLSHGNYLCAQVETPLRDSTFYYLNNGTYEPQLSGRFMIGAVVDTPYINDVALLELVHPVSGCDLGHEHLNVLLTNNGTTDIVPPIQLHYTVNGGSVVTENFTDTLHSHETTVFTFNSIYDFTNNQLYQDVNYAVKVWATKLTQDRLTFNDTLALTVISKGKAVTPIVQDTVIVNYHTPTTLTAQLPAAIPQGVLGWFTSAGYESWNLLGYGNTYTTPIIYFDTTYYVTANPGTVDDVIVGTGTGSGTDPFTFTNGYSRGRTIYLEQEVGHGTITSFALNVKSASTAAAAAGIPMKIYMKCTDDNVYSSTAVNWEDEVLGATLVLDDRVFFDHTGWFYFDMLTPFDFNSGNLEIFMETNCADYCTGSGTQCNNCGQYVSGAQSYPQFYMTNSPTGIVQCQKKAANTMAQMASAYTNVSKRLNARFTVANLDCGSVKVPVYLHVPDIPDYDVETQELLYPESGCALYNENIQVQVKNMLNTAIPANKVVVHAIFNGSEITHTVAEPFSPEEVKVVEFATPFDFSAPTNNITFNYTIYTTLNNETVVYGGNDTISGTLQSTRTAHLPDSIVYQGSYTQPYTILQPADRPSDITQYYFYDSQDAATPVHTTTTAAQYMTTDPLYSTAVYWMSGKTQQSNCITKRIKVIVDIFTPQYDLSTEELIYPVSYQCATSLNPQLQVSVMNQDTTSNTQIPAGTFKLNANFTGSATVNGTSTISTPISSLQLDTITFDNGINLGSTTQNRIYQYLIYTTPVDPNLQVYKANDTISGTMYFPALPQAPQALSFTVPYGGTHTVTPSSAPLNHYYFYENATDNQAIAEGSSFTTDPIYGPTTYYYSGRIESNGFSSEVIPNTGSVSCPSNMPFNFDKGHSYAKVLFNKEDMGGVEGRIDSIFFNLCSVEGNGVAIPMKFWLANTADAQAIATGNTSINWPTETSNATLVYDGDMFFDQSGWVGFAINGGFDYAGEGLFLYAEHNCGDNSCKNNLGVNPNPKFSNNALPQNSKRMLTNAPSNNNPLTAAATFTLTNSRIQTKFVMNYTCESPKATITINTTVPQHDVGVTAITAPVSQSNTFTANQPVTVTLKNFGSQAASNFPVSYQLANNTPQTQNYTGSLAAGATATMTFTTNADLTSVYFPTPFRAYTGLTTDTYHANDTTTIFLSKEDPCPSRPLALNTGAHITNVTMGSLNNGTAAPYTNHPAAPGNGMYTDYTQTVAPVELILGQEYTISIAHAFTSTGTKTVYKRAFIDYNRNGEFENSEAITISPAITAGEPNAVTLDTFNVDVNANVGLTRMRVICTSVANMNSPCGFYNNNATGEGETEDYAVLLSAPMQVDLGVSDVIHPVGDVCADTNAVMRVQIRNFGTESQTFSMANPVTITANITGAVPGTYTQTVENGMLASNQEMTVTLPNVNLSGLGNYHVNILLTYSGDQYLTNNTRSADAVVSDQTVEQLPFVEPFTPVGEEGSYHFSDDWILDGQYANYKWDMRTGASQNHSFNPSGGPAGDHTSAGTSLAQYGGYATVNGVNSTTNLNKMITLTSRCINMHYRDIYPAELNFYKYLTGQSTSDFDLYVETGSGKYYQQVDHLTKANGSAEWTNHLTVLTPVDEVARLRFTLTNHKYRIDPSIDDINLVVGQPDLRIRVDYPEDKSTATSCLQVNSVVVPQVTIFNDGNSAVEEFDVIFRVGTSNDIVSDTEHVVHHIEPGDTIAYTSVNEYVVTNIDDQWEVRATVKIANDKKEFGNTDQTHSCTNLPVEEFDMEDNVYLGQNVPNPSITVTRIPYSVPAPGKVTLEVVNAAGQVVYTATQEAELGVEYFEVNTTDFAAGAYFYTIYYNEVVLTKKMVVEK